jgi:hypothetical protein
VPCFYERVLVEWIAREQGGGLVASYDPDDKIVDTATADERGKLVLDNGHILVDTAYWYCLIKVDDVWKQCVIPFKSTALKTSRKWNSTIATTYIPGTQKQGPRWLHQYKFQSIKEQKDNFVWSSPVITQDVIVTKAVYDAAKSYALIAAKGILRRKVLVSEAQNQTSVKQTIDDEVPF